MARSARTARRLLGRITAATVVVASIGAVGAIGTTQGASAAPLPLLAPACRDLVAVDVVHEFDDVTAPDEDIDENGLRVAFTTASPTCAGLSVYRVRAVTATGQVVQRSVTGGGAAGFRVDLGPIDGPVCVDVTSGLGLLGQTLAVTDRIPDRGCIDLAPGTGEPPTDLPCADVVDGGNFDDGTTSLVAGFLAAAPCPGLVVVSRFSHQGTNLDGPVRQIQRYDVAPQPPQTAPDEFGRYPVVVPEYVSDAGVITWAGGTALALPTGAGETAYLLLDELPDGGVVNAVRDTGDCPDEGGCGGFRFK